MLRVLTQSIQFWMLIGAVIGGGIDCMIGGSPDWGIGLLVGLVAGGILGYVRRRGAR